MITRSRFVHPRTRHRKVWWSRSTSLLVAVMLSLGFVVAAVVVVAGSSGDPQVVTPRGAGSLPGSVLALAAGRIVELSSSDGAVVRELARSATGTAHSSDDPGAWSSLSVSPDGRFALASGGGQPRTCPQSPSVGDDLTRINLTDGTVDNIDLGTGALAALDPEFSPDGTRFASVEYRCQPEPRRIDTAEPNALVVRDSAGTEERRFTLPFLSPADGNHTEVIGIAGWEADGRHLLVQVQHEPTVELWRVDSESPSGTLVGEALPNPQSALLVSVFPVPLGDSGRWVAPLRRVGNEPATVVEYDPYTGTTARVLLRWATLPADAGGPTVVDSDATGRHLLLVANLNGGPTALYRWSEGDAEPTKLAENMGDDGAWLRRGGQTVNTPGANATTTAAAPPSTTGTVPATAETSNAPEDNAEAEQAIIDAINSAFGAENEVPIAESVEGGHPFVDPEDARAAANQAASADDVTRRAYEASQQGSIVARINWIQFEGKTRAQLNFDLLANGALIAATTTGSAVFEHERWRLGRSTFCEIVARGGINSCPG